MLGNTSGLQLIKLHSMDSAGTVAGIIGSDGHQMRISPWYADCGATGERVECSCGFVSEASSGHGCWQYGHDGEAKAHVWAELDATEPAMLFAAYILSEDQGAHDTAMVALHCLFHREAHSWASRQPWLE